MKAKYTIKIIMDDDIIEKSGDNVSELEEWAKKEAERNHSDITVEVYDNVQHKIIKSFHE